VERESIKPELSLVQFDLIKNDNRGLEEIYLSGGILVCYSLLGIAQETITKASYGDEKVLLIETVA